jgi:hypothetical protein
MVGDVGPKKGARKGESRPSKGAMDDRLREVLSCGSGLSEPLALLDSASDGLA